MNDSVFVSYARLDQDFVLQLAQALKERGVSIWIDQWDIPLGANWDRCIDDAIRNSNKFLIVLSPAATASESAGEVRGELRRALEQQKEIVPVLYQPCEIPRQLLEINYADFSGGLNEELLDRLARRLLEQEPEVPQSERIKFINALHDVPKDARAFDEDLSHAQAVELSKRLSDAQFIALRNISAWRNRYDRDARIILTSDALKRIGGSTLETARSFEILTQFGLFTVSPDSRQGNRSDLSYDYTPLFFTYTNLQRYLRVANELETEEAADSEYWLSSRG
jgi:hypothetical protein